MFDKASSLGLEMQSSSAKQINQLAELHRRFETSERKEKAIYRQGAEEQISSSATLDKLLKHALEQAKEQEERRKLEDTRYHENLRLTKIAACTGVLGTILAIVSIALQFFF